MVLVASRESGNGNASAVAHGVESDAEIDSERGQYCQ